MAENGTTLAKAYVQISPSTKGMGAELIKGASNEVDSAGTSFGKSLGSKIKGLIATAGIGMALKTALDEGAKLQQSQGGIETLFKDSADKMKGYAEEAYKTAGVSANDYMEQATSFSASLLASLGGDTEKAAESANQAIIDMADNSNKMGTSLESIQNAYQGFAKGNYTMLDNLKLGYGGTKTEMQRLLADAEKFSGVKYDINNLNDVYSAIHVVQDQLDITGTTAKESASTLSGSFASMKASATNFLGHLVVGDDLQPAMTGLVETSTTFLFDNLIPAVGNIVMNLPSAIGTFIQTATPLLFENSTKLINTLLKGVTEKGPDVISNGAQMIGKFIKGLIQQLPTVVTTAGTMVANLVSGLIANLPAIGKGVLEIIGSIKDGLLSVDWVGLGMDILRGIGNGIANVGGAIGGAISNAASGLLSSFKNALGIHSPSRVFRDEIGYNIMTGLAEGIKENSGLYDEAVDDAIGGINMDYANGSISTVGTFGQSDNAMTQVINLLSQLLNATNRDSYLVVNGRQFAMATASDIDYALGVMNKKGGRK